MVCLQDNFLLNILYPRIATNGANCLGNYARFVGSSLSLAGNFSFSYVNFNTSHVQILRDSVFHLRTGGGADLSLIRVDGANDVRIGALSLRRSEMSVENSRIWNFRGGVDIIDSSILKIQNSSVLESRQSHLVLASSNATMSIRSSSQFSLIEGRMEIMDGTFKVDDNSTFTVFKAVCTQRGPAMFLCFVGQKIF